MFLAEREPVAARSPAPDAAQEPQQSREPLHVGQTPRQTRVRPVIAFVLRTPLRGPGLTSVDAIRAVDFVVPALEITDGASAERAVVLGSRPTRVDAVDLRLVGCNLYRNGEVVRTGAGGAVRGSPIAALA